MIDLFMPFRKFLKLKNVCTDNNVFRMHYTITVFMLLVFALLVTTKQFFGEPMHCFGDEESKNKDAINSYCWIYGTYTLTSSLQGVEGKHMAYPGVGTYKGKNDVQIKHTYYQWVCFVLLGQALMFYIPRYLWKVWEGGRLKDLVANLASPIVSKEWSQFRRNDLVSYLMYSNSYTHNMYALRYAFCEILNLVNVIGQIYLLDIFLGGAFHDYGAAVAAFTHIPKVPTDMKDFISVNPMDKYFPKLTKCFLRTYGPSGGLQFKDRLCVLPLNIVNEKIFVILWFWLLFLAFVSILAVLFRILVFALPPLRTALVMGQLRYGDRKLVVKIVKKFSFGDWFIVYLLGKNMNPIIFKDLIIELSKSTQQQQTLIV